jgi:hypothetical protein
MINATLISKMTSGVNPVAARRRGIILGVKGIRGN